MKRTHLEITVLCENSVGGPFGLIGEHGWSVLVEVRGRTILFDTGQGLGLANNSARLGKDLSKVELLVLSHGHYDHASGIPQAASFNQVLPVVCHPDVFIPRYWIRDGEKRYIGMIHSRKYLESIGCHFRFTTDFTEILPGIYVTGQVPRETDFEPPDPNMAAEENQNGSPRLVQDQLSDDMSMVVDTPSGVVIVLGCAHAGLVNIINHVRRNLPGRRIHAVIGGTHLGFASKDQFERTLDMLERLEIEKIGASHCTGLGNSALMSCRLGKRFFHASVGTALTV